ncbi:hect-domain-containing protein [Pyrenophora seminiperda CCB06]|uniref:Hect-domain-containing protein n=1 Tax=Pyrenophora seminiperda CCB06 TaxID=1302712 RepID=A0A3M7ML74_9PLEO|nr:hect-domain-containing protein [Pyrenophora seminiperda CCB06]
MPTKRKQRHGEPSTSSLSSVPLKKTKTNMQPASKVIPKAVPKVIPKAAPKRKRLDDEHTNDASTTLSSSRPVKKARKPLNSAPAKQPTHSQPSSSSIALPSKKEKPVTQTHTQQATKVSKPSATLSSLIPQVPRQRATLGHKDESLLHIIGKSSVTGKRNDLHFRLIPHSSIDWNDAQHINKINSWRNQIYQRAGIKTRLITSWHPLEEIWMELYYQLSIVEAREREIQLPTPKQLRDAFNEIFVGRVLKDKYGGDLDPRSERHATAFGSKFNRMCPVLKARLSNCVSGKGGEGFLPGITFEMLQLYKAEKAALAEKGIKSDSEDADGMEEWQRVLSQLSSIADTETQDLIQEEGKK